MNRTLITVLALVAIVGGGAFFFFGQSQSTAPSLAAVAQDAENVDTSGILEMSIGNPDAKVTVMEYASFTCPHCKSFHENAFGALKANYIDTGKINFVYREVYFDRFGLWAGLVARCGGAEKYFGISDLLYKGQSDWLAGGDPNVIVNNLRKIGKTAGLNDDQLDACLNDAEKAKAFVASFQQNAQADGVNSSPTLFVDGEKYGNMSFADLAKLIDENLAE